MKGVKRKERRHIKISTRYLRRDVMGSALGTRRYCVSTVLGRYSITLYCIEGHCTNSSLNVYHGHPVPDNRIG